MRRFDIWLILALVGFISGNACGVINAAEIDYPSLINLAGRQRMLTQKMSKEILLISLKMEVDKNKEALKKTAALFEHTLNGLLNGVEELNLKPAESDDIKAQLQKVKSLWEESKPIVEKTIASGEVPVNTIKKVAELNVPLLTETNKAVQIYEAVAAERVGGKKAEVVINLAGRQRMLSQKMSKELLLIAQKVNVEGNKTELKKTADLFDRTLKGLISGDTEFGLPPTTNKDILAQLNKVQAIWNDFKPSIYEVAITGTTPEDAVRKVVRLNLPLLTETNKAVEMYEEEARKQPPFR